MRRADDRDADVGNRVREHRIEQGMSQTELGNAIGVTFQQVQKYESGANRISSGRLQRIAEALAVPSAHFFQKNGANGRTTSSRRQSWFPADDLQVEGAERLLKAFNRIADRNARGALLCVAARLAGLR